MKNLIKIILLMALVFACTRKEEKLSLFSPESFAYELDSGWELNGSVRVKGLRQEKRNDNYIAKLSYSIDLITPAGDTLKNAYDGIKDVKNGERISDTSIDVQIELDSTFARGNYVIHYFVRDDLTSKSAEISDTVSVGM